MSLTLVLDLLALPSYGQVINLGQQYNFIDTFHHYKNFTISI